MDQGIPVPTPGKSLQHYFINRDLDLWKREIDFNKNERVYRENLYLVIKTI